MERPARREQLTCEYCEFYAGGEAMGSSPGDDSDGACRRYAPRGVWPTRLVDGTERTADEITAMYLWPMVNGTDWCGEFERFRPEVKEGDGII